MTNEKRPIPRQAGKASPLGADHAHASNPLESQYRIDPAEMMPKAMHTDNRAPVSDGANSFQFEELSRNAPQPAGTPLDFVRDVELNLRIELGRTHLPLEEVLRLHKGSVVALDRLAGEPVDVYANDSLIARGEVVVVNESFSVRVTELVRGTQAA